MQRSLALLAGVLVSTPVVFVQQAFAQNEAREVEEVITTGTRAQERSSSESPAPIDVITGEDFTNQAETDLANLVRNVVPSFNVNTQPISDAATIVRPANLRGLAPDHTLV
ncbi:MAG: TonB-dependent receptor plug domain-containing protein, partial [Gammaproteobacteria bacterium]|nr:TonB-dependent receptor plug domain-containing protein [Gammaproteobacteria bacterium]